jgi:glycosyltransferase involved in cell wall biosynthesis
MKVAVYTIALNEEQFVKSWYESAKEADYLLIADTGSTDNTARVAQKLGINVVSISVKPWRFEDARNAALALLPEDVDYCIALDMDEVLLPNWRVALEGAHSKGVTRPRYTYTWSWNPDGAPGLQYGGDKIHTRKNYRWKHPVHEVLNVYGISEVQDWVDLEIHHYPDNTKPRSQYLPLLKLSVEEDPSDDRNAFYYARELFFYSQYYEAAEEFKRHLSLPKARWAPERAASMRYLAKCEPDNKEEWLIKAHMESSNRREALVELAQHLYETESWASCLHFAEKALAIKEKPLDYLCEEFAWGSLPYDLAAIASYWLEDIEKALEYGLQAAQLEPSNQRLQNNLTFYQAGR